MIELELVGVRIELPHNQPLVLLKERTGERFLPIWIGENEAKAIAHALQGYVPPRPLTHDLLRDLVDALDASVDRVVVTALHEGTYFAEIRMTRAGESVTVPSRPSDAIALAVRSNSAIYADEAVLDIAGMPMEDEEEEEVEQFKEFLDNVTPEDFR